jgi:hypothetical protein
METKIFGLRCPYCCADFSRSFREFPVLKREEYIKHVVDKHDVPDEFLAERQFSIRMESFKEEIV